MHVRLPPSGEETRRKLIGFSHSVHQTFPGLPADPSSRPLRMIDRRTAFARDVRDGFARILGVDKVNTSSSLPLLQRRRHAARWVRRNWRCYSRSASWGMRRRAAPQNRHIPDRAACAPCAGVALRCRLASRLPCFRPSSFPSRIARRALADAETSGCLCIFLRFEAQTLQPAAKGDASGLEDLGSDCSR